MIVLDTDTVTHFSYGQENVRRRIAAAGDELLAIAIVTRIEILRGRADTLLKAADEEELRRAMDRYSKAEQMLGAFRVLPVDDEAVRHFGRLRKQSSLKKMGRADMLIACIALANDALLVTRNTKDYKALTELRTENWVD